MTLQSSGQISATDIRTEFGGGSGQISMGDYFRGAAANKVRNNAANNSSTNLAAGVPTSGALAFDDFYSQARGFRKTYSAGATNQNASTIFGDDWAVDYPKQIVINSGVELGATTTGEWALELNSGGSGTITVDNAGTLTGKGGNASSAGGDAVRVNVSNVTINNTGTIRGGGGGGGTGGSGGNGGSGGQGGFTLRQGNYTGNRVCSSTGQPVYGCDGFGSCAMGEGGRIKQYNVTNVAGGAGGSGGSGGNGGSGGVGQGYQQANPGSGGSGNSGSAGNSGANGTNWNADGCNGGSGRGGNGGSGGNGGNGGSGGNYGSAGSSGNNGGSGNSGSAGATGSWNYYGQGSDGTDAGDPGGSGGGGSSGSSGGAAGRAVQRDVAYTMNNNGTLQGAYT